MALNFLNNATFAGAIFLSDNRDIGWSGGYSAGKPTLAAVGTTMKMFPSGSVSGEQFTLTPTTATFSGSVIIAASNDLRIDNGSLTSSQSSTTNPVARFTNTGVNNYDFTFPNNSTLQLGSSIGTDLVFKLLNAGAGDFNLDVGGDVTIGSSGASSDKTLNILTGGTKSSVKLMEAGTVYGFSTIYDGATNKFHINRHNNSAAGTPVLSLNRDDDNATFAGLVSGITPVAAANFVTKAYVDGSGGGTGPFLPLAGGTMTGNVLYEDSVQIQLGNSADLLIFHDGADSYIKDNGTGILFIRASSGLRLQGANGESMIDANENGAVNLYYDNVLKFQTTAGGTINTGTIDSTGTITVTGANGNVGINTDTGKLLLGASYDLQLYHDGSHSFISDQGTGNLTMLASTFVVNNASDTENMIIASSDGSVNLYYDGSQKFRTISTGVEVTGDADVSSTVLVGNNNSIFAENNLRFKSAGAAFIDHNTVGQSIKFRLSNSSSLDVTPFEITPSYAAFAGDVLVEDNLYLTDAGTVRGKIQLNASDRDDLDIKAVSLGSNMKFFTVDTERMRINSSGNVGIGTTGPSSKLDIQQTTAGNIISTEFDNLDYTAGNRNAIKIRQQTTASGSFSAFLGSTQDGKLFLSNDSITADHLVIDTTGNIGMGYTSPSDFTSVGADNLVVGPLSGNNGITVNSATSGYGALAFADGTGASDQYRGLIQYNHTANSLALFTNASTKMTILSGGNVGISTTNPQFKLQVSGSVALDVMPSNETEGTVRIGRYDANTSRYNDIKSYVSSTAASNYLKFAIHGGVENTTVDVMTLKGNGDVGIGTTSPVGKFTVQGDEADIFLRSNDYTIARLINRGSTGTNLDTGLFSLFVQNTENVRIDAGGNSWLNGGDVGFGTTSPSQKLHISGNMRLTGAFRDGLNSQGAANYVLTSTGSNGTRWVDGADIPGVPGGSGTVNTIPLWTPDGDTLGNSIITQPTSSEVRVAGTLKVNSTVDGYSSTKIQTGGFGDSQSGINILNSTTGYGYILFGDGSGADLYRGQIAYKHDDDYMAFNTAGSERIRIISNGNVGIGATAPTGKLEIQRSQVTTQFDRDCFLRLHPSATTNSGGFTNIMFGTSTVNNYGVAVGGIRAGTGDTSSNNNPEFSVRILNDAITGIEVLNINTTGSVKFNAYNGTNNTGSPTHILGTDANGLIVKSTAGSSIGPWLPLAAGSGDPLTGDLYLDDGSGASPSIYFKNEANNFWRYLMESGGDFSIKEGTSTRLTFQAGGNVGIGTTSPADALGISVPSGTTKGIYFQDSGTTNYGTILQYVEQTNLFQIKQEENGVQTGILTIKRADGNVGIGTTNPQNLLHLGDNANSKAGTIRIDSFVANQFWKIEPGTNTLNIKDYDGTSLVSFNGASNYVLFNGGNVGIGTTSPDSKLDVTGGDITVNTSGVGFMNFKYGSVGSESTMGSIQTTGIDLKINATSDLLLLPGSNVGIGTTSPLYKLHIIDSTASGRAVQGIQSATSGTNYGAVFTAEGSGATKNVGLYADAQGATTNYAAIFDNGNVGIGTTSPTGYRLVVENASEDLLKLHNSTDGLDALISFTNPGGTLARIQGIDNGGLGFDVGNNAGGIISNAMFVKNNGNVGIGTTAPTEKLQVAGNAAFYGAIRGYTGSSSNQYLSIFQSFSNTFISTGTSGETIYFSIGPTTNVTNINVAGTATATNFILSSDETLKDKIKDIETKHINVEWKNFELISEPGVKRSGVIAQELEEKHPEFVRTDKDGLKSVAYIDLLITKIAELEARLEKAGL